MKPVWKCLLTVTLCITALFLCIFLSSPAKAAVVNSGSCGANATWTLTDDGTLAISGTGSVFDNPCPGYEDRVKTLVIEEGITTIGMDAFANYTALSQVSLPRSLEFISFDAFENCTMLQTVAYGGYLTDKATLSIASGNAALLQATWTYAECPAHQYEAVCSPICTICGAERITQHTPGSWQSNDDFHFRDCALCGTPLETEAHHFVDGICNVCAHQKRSVTLPRMDK